MGEAKRLQNAFGSKTLGCRLTRRPVLKGMCDVAPHRGALVCSATSDGVGLGKLYPEQLESPWGTAVEILDQKGPGFLPRSLDVKMQQANILVSLGS